MLGRVGGVGIFVEEKGFGELSVEGGGSVILGGSNRTMIRLPCPFLLDLLKFFQMGEMMYVTAMLAANWAWLIVLKPFIFGIWYGILTRVGEGGVGVGSSVAGLAGGDCRTYSNLDHHDLFG